MANTRSSTTSSSRKPRTAARAASRPATTRRAAESEEDFADAEVTAAVAQEIEAEGNYVTATLCGEEVQIIPPSAWRVSWNRMLMQGLIDGFAEKVLAPEDYDFFIELDPTAQEFQDFVQEASEKSGEPLGKSGPRSRSGRPTRRR